jgi:hypothetical protein
VNLPPASLAICRSNFQRPAVSNSDADGLPPKADHLI